MQKIFTLLILLTLKLFAAEEVKHRINTELAPYGVVISCYNFHLLYLISKEYDKGDFSFKVDEILSITSRQLQNANQLQSLENLSINLKSDSCNNIALFPNLNRLYLEGNLEKAPEIVVGITGLTTLSMQHNLITALPSDFGRLYNLEELNLAGNQLTDLPSSFSQLTKLRKLDLSSNLFEDVPEVLNEIPSLNYLNLSHNSITSLSLHSIKVDELNLSNNNMKVIEPCFNSVSVRNLNLSDNNLGLNHLTLWNLSGLRDLLFLDLTGNRISRIPASIGHIINLHVDSEMLADDGTGNETAMLGINSLIAKGINVNIF